MSPLLNYSFLNDAPPFLFFTGKGGVGKTSLPVPVRLPCVTAANGYCWSARIRHQT